MDNKETRATLGHKTQNEERKNQNKQNKTKNNKKQYRKLKRSQTKKATIFLVFLYFNTIVLSVLRITTSGYPFGIFKLFCQNRITIDLHYIINFVQKSVFKHYILYIYIDI